MSETKQDGEARAARILNSVVLYGLLGAGILFGAVVFAQHLKGLFEILGSLTTAQQQVIARAVGGLTTAVCGLAILFRVLSRRV